MVPLKEVDLKDKADREFNRRTLQLNADVTRIRAAVDEAVASMARLEASTRKTYKRLDGLAAGIENVHKRFGKFDARLGVVDGRLDAMDGRLGGIDGRLGGIDDRLDKVELYLHHIDTEIDKIGYHWSNAIRRLDTVELWSKSVNEKLEGLDALEIWSTSVDGKIEGIDGKLDRLIDAVLGGGESAN